MCVLFSHARYFDKACISHSRPIIFRGEASCGGTQLPVSPLEENSEWRCDRCPVVLTSSEEYDLVSRIGEEVDNVQAVSAEIEMKRFAVLWILNIWYNIKAHSYWCYHACLCGSQYRKANDVRQVWRTHVQYLWISNYILISDCILVGYFDVRFDSFLLTIRRNMLPLTPTYTKKCTQFI